MKRSVLWLSFSFIILFLLLSGCGYGSGGTGTPSPSTAINVVAAENFYGDVVKQLGGSHVSVTNIISNPNIDPHEYESNVQIAIMVSKAQFVIKNGGGYDGWMDRLLSASPNQGRLALTAVDSAPVKLPDNVHVWYSIEDMQSLAQVITADLKKLDAADSAEFESNLQTFMKSLKQIQQKIDEIKGKYAGRPVGLTETVYLYQTGPLGLNVLTPFDFQKAVAEGNDPPASALLIAERQINQRQIKALINNTQAITPTTTMLLNDARAQGIPIVSITETMPSGKTYQVWMLDQLNALEQALGR